MQEILNPLILELASKGFKPTNSSFKPSNPGSNKIKKLQRNSYIYKPSYSTDF